MVCLAGSQAFAEFDMNGVSGTIIFEQSVSNGPTTITVDLNGLGGKAGNYHVHQTAILKGTQNCTSTGGHFNPFNIDYANVRDRCASYDYSNTCELGDLRCTSHNL